MQDLELLLEPINKLIDGLREVISNGGAPTLEAYKFDTGRLAGLKEARALFVQANAKIIRDEDEGLEP